MLNYLKTYKLFENNENIYEIIQLFKDNCKEFLFDDTKIFRSVNINKKWLKWNKSLTKSTYLYKGKKFRNSAYMNGENTYTFIINHTEPWKNYPKRELICSLNTIRAFSNSFYRVIPYDNTKWGVVPSNDIQDTKFYEIQNFNRFDVEDYLNHIEEYEQELLKDYTPEQELEIYDQVKIFHFLHAPDIKRETYKSYQEFIKL